MTFIKGNSYNFIVERIAEAQNSYYYVIKIGNKECWIKMYPYQIYQDTHKDLLRCEYRGTDSYGSPLFVQDRLSILYELYKPNAVYPFVYIKEGIDMYGNDCAILRDNYGLTHYIYDEPSLKGEAKSAQVLCKITGFDKGKKILLLKRYSVANQNTTLWIDIESMFKIIGKEYLLHEYYHNIVNNTAYRKSLNQADSFVSLMEKHDITWIKRYCIFLDKRLKNQIIQLNDYKKLEIFSSLMLEILKWANSNYKNLVSQSIIRKYEALQQAIMLCKDGKTKWYLDQFLTSEQLDNLKNGNIILSLIEIDSLLFQNDISQYIKFSEHLYKNSKQVYPRFIDAFISILSHRIDLEINNKMQWEEHSNHIPNLLAFLTVLIIFLSQKKDEKLQYYKDQFFTICNQQNCTAQFLSGINDEFTWDSIQAILRISHAPTKIVISALNNNVTHKEEQNAAKFKKTTQKTTIAFLNLFTDGSYCITDEYCEDNDISKSIPLYDDLRNGYMLLCYEKGSVNKILIRTLIEKKKRGYKYMNGCYHIEKLKEIFCIKKDSFIVAISTYNGDKFIKIYNTKNITKHLALSSKGNQIVDSIIDSIEYYLVPNECEDRLPKRLIYYSPQPIGKDLTNEYYESDIQIIRDMNIPL